LIKDNTDRLITSDYKSAKVLFKDILISLVCNVYPKLTHVEAVYYKAVDAYQKLDGEKVDEKLDLIKMQMFCIVYRNCYDEKSSTIVSFDNVSEEHKNIIKLHFNEILETLQHLSESNYLEYYSEQSFTDAEKQRYQNRVDTIDHIKNSSYKYVCIQDMVYELNDFAVKAWSLRKSMIPEGKDDALFSAMNTITPAMAVHQKQTTIQTSIYKDKSSTWFINLHLPDDCSNWDVSMICKFQKENKEAAFFLPCKINSVSWKVDTSFLTSQDEGITFYIFKPGQVTGDQYQSMDTYKDEEIGKEFPPFVMNQMQTLKKGLDLSRAILDSQDYKVVTVLGLKNLTNSSVKLANPAMTSGCESSTYPWPKEVSPLTSVNLVTRKQSFSLKGCVGGTLLEISPTFHVLLFWQTPLNQNLHKNCFGIGCYSGDGVNYYTLYRDLLEKVTALPDIVPTDISFHLQQAEDGPVCVKLPNNMRVSANMTTDHKAVFEVILYNIKHI